MLRTICLCIRTQLTPWQNRGDERKSGAKMSQQNGMSRPTAEQAEETHQGTIEDSPYPICIFDADTRKIITRNTLFTELFSDKSETVDTLFSDKSETVDTLFSNDAHNYERFIHRLEKEGSVTRYETTRSPTDSSQTDFSLGAKRLTGNAILLTVADITEWKRRERISAIQRDLGFALASCPTLDDALKHCFAAAMAVTGMECGGIYLIDPRTGDFVLQYSKNLSEPFVTAARRSPHDASSSHLIAGGVPVYTNYGDIQTSVNEAARTEKLRAVALIPMTNRGKMIGSFNIASRHMDIIPFQTRTELELIASHVGTAIARFQAEEEIRTSRYDMQEFFDTIQDFIFVLNAEGQIIRTNTAVSERLGYTEEELLRMNVVEVHPPERQEEAQAIVADMIAGTRDFCPIPLQAKDGTEIPVETRVSFGHWSGEEVLFGLSRDITEREKAKELLERHDAILNAVSFAAHGFLKAGRWDKQIDAVLEELGHATGVDRVYIFRNHTAADDTLLSSQEFEWCAPGIRPEIGNPDLQNVAFAEAGYSRWIAVLEKGGAIVGDIDEFPPAEQEILRPQDIQSLAVVPIISDERWWGFIGFDACRQERAWSDAEIDVLKVAADILGSAIHQTMMQEVFRRPVERSFIGTYLTSETGFEYVNPRFADIFGYGIDEMLHKDYIEDLIHPDDRQAVRDKIHQRFSGVKKPLHNEFRGITKTGAVIDIDAYGTVIDYKGNPAIVGNIMDITERKRYEKELRDSLDEKVVLLNEIHHRVKNNLQIISAFIKLQMMYMDDDAGKTNLLECDNQILTMALIHESLYQSNSFTHIPLKDHVTNLVSNITGSSDNHLHYQPDLNVEDIILPIDAIIPCSLTITEFINLAQRYAIPGIQTHPLEIAIHRVPGDRISLDIQTDGIALPTKTGNFPTGILELEMIQTLMTKQMKGSMDIQTENGMRITILFPNIRR